MNGPNSYSTLSSFAGGLSVAEWTNSGTAQGALPLANPNPATTRADLQYTRGPDMGGGVGGLLHSKRKETAAANATPTYTHKFNLANGRGDIIAQTDSTGALTWTASYDASGRRPKETGSNADRQRSNSKEEDETGLVNDHHRYRDPVTLSYLTLDPAGFVDGPNLYAYVNQNPWSKFDPEGLYEVAPNQPVHELMTATAYANAVGCFNNTTFSDYKSSNPSAPFEVRHLVAGVRSIDYGFLPTARNVTGNLALAMLVPPLGALNAVMAGANAYRLHLGDLQWKHSMSSGETSSLELRNKITTNLIGRFDSAKKQYAEGQRATAWATIGQILHTVQDSFSTSHTKRNDLGEITEFHNYNIQDSKLHASADRIRGESAKYSLRPINIDHATELANHAWMSEALESSTRIIKMFQAGDSRGFGNELERVFRISKNSAVNTPGSFSRVKKTQ